MEEYQFAGFIPHEEFVRRVRETMRQPYDWEEELAKLRAGQRNCKKQTRKQPKQKKMNKEYRVPKNKQWKRAPDPQQKDQPSSKWENKLDKLTWRSVYLPAEVQYMRSPALNQLTVTVPGYHSQTYPLHMLLNGYAAYRGRRGGQWNDINLVMSGQGMHELFHWLINTGQFPYPYEVATGVRRHYIDMKPLL